VVDASAHRLYHLVTDVTRGPEWLPDVRSATWVAARPVVVSGARFEVRLRPRWRRPLTFEVEVAEPGRAFAFSEVGGRRRWSLSFEDGPVGTELALTIEPGGAPSTAAVLESIARTAEGRTRVAQPQLGQALTA
jgi:hypothetical protein